jgi:hypothetical protein
MHAMMPVIPRSGSRKVNGYVKAVLALEAVRRKREAWYDCVVLPLDRSAMTREDPLLAVAVLEVADVDTAKQASLISQHNARC